VLDQIQQKKEDHAVEELLAGHIPLLICSDADGEGHHENCAADERDAREDAQDEGEAEDGFEKRNGVAQGVGKGVGSGDLARCSAVVCAKAATPLWMRMRL
jgi:hypothetical protein